jgi:hypothetical protein
MPELGGKSDVSRYLAALSGCVIQLRYPAYQLIWIFLVWPSEHHVGPRQTFP